MLKLNAINVLLGLQAALAAPESERLAVYRERVMEPLRPFWEPFLSWMGPKAASPEGDATLNAARTFNYYVPDGDTAAGLQALGRLEQAGTWAACVEAAQSGWRRLDPPAHQVVLEHINFAFMLGDQQKMTASLGAYTGFGGVPGVIIVLAWPTDFNLPRLPAAVAHELNHNVRFGVEPFPRDGQVVLGQYLVAEGLAEAFAAELCGQDKLGPWADALSPAQLDEVRPRFKAALDLRGFDVVRSYIFGDSAAGQSGYTPIGLPDFAGYTVGYRVVKAYLERSGKTAAAVTYVPWADIIAGSSFFD